MSLATLTMPAESTTGGKLAGQIPLGTQRVVDLEEDCLCCSGWILADFELIRLGSRRHSQISSKIRCENRRHNSCSLHPRNYPFVHTVLLGSSPSLGKEPIQSSKSARNGPELTLSWYNRELFFAKQHWKQPPNPI